MVIYDAENVPITYVNKPDTVVNANGNRIATICNITNVAIVNNSWYRGHVIESPLTYRQGNTCRRSDDEPVFNDVN